MKKSKIIVPALALLLLSTAASVSGTVAWFTASRTFETTISDFYAKSADGNLVVEMGSGVGVTAALDKQTASLNSNVNLADASFSIGDGHLYTDTVASGTYKDLGAYNDAQVSSKWLVGGTTYYGVSWTMDFKYTFAADLTQQNLYLDPTSVMTIGDEVTAKTGTHTELVEKGFRIAFYGTTATVANKKVWSDTQTDALMTSAGHVSSTSATATYTSGQVISTADTGGTSGLVAATAATAGTSAANCLGYFTGVADSTVTISFTCVAWFEGLDANVITGAAINEVSATMKFFVTPNA